MADQKSARGSFPAKLYDLVDSHSNVPEDEAIVSWCENGLAFIVRDLTRFCEEVLPAHFCHNKWASFIRQLNLYGFRRITQGASSGAYWHKFFQRGEPHLLRASRCPATRSSAAPENTSVVAKNTPSFFVEKTPSFVAEKTPPFVEGEVHVLARCRFQGCDRGALAWRQAFYSVDLVGGRCASSAPTRTGARGAARAARTSPSGRRSSAATTSSRRRAAPPSAGKRNGEVAALRSRTCPSPRRTTSRPGLVLEDAASREGDLPLRNRPAPLSCADCARGVDYCSFEVWKRADVGGDGSGAPLLKFAAAPDDRDDLDVLHDALEAISLTSATHVIEP
ncbi:DNA binding protein [Aureococcus anophagefferens]|nr:DNA binding protein [Aureococcus anophagefferens]